MALSAETIAALKQAVATWDRNKAELKAEIDRAQLAGLDTSDLRTRYTQAENQITKIKAQYGAELK